MWLAYGVFLYVSKSVVLSRAIWIPVAALVCFLQPSARLYWNHWYEASALHDVSVYSIAVAVPHFTYPEGMARQIYLGGWYQDDANMI